MFPDRWTFRKRCLGQCGRDSVWAVYGAAPASGISCRPKEAVRADGMGSCAGVREAEPRDEYFMVSFLTPRPLHSFLSTIKMSQILWLQTVCGTWVSPS